jgi:hypothetical protein
MTGTDKLGECALTQSSPPPPTTKTVMMVRGWGYIGGPTPPKQVSWRSPPKTGTITGSYRVIRQSGSTGIQHDPSTGENLDQADFAAAFSVDTTTRASIGWAF